MTKSIFTEDGRRFSPKNQSDRSRQTYKPEHPLNEVRNPILNGALLVIRSQTAVTTHDFVMAWRQTGKEPTEAKKVLYRKATMGSEDFGGRSPTSSF